jgi:hypothetical protein
MSVSRGYSRHAALGAVRQEVEDMGDLATRKERSLIAMLIERVVMVASGIIIGLLMIRMILSLLGANRANMFTDFIYTASHPFVTPFFRLFNYRLQYGESRFEVETLIAAAVYAIIAALILTILAVPIESERS